MPSGKRVVQLLVILPLALLGLGVTVNSVLATGEEPASPPAAEQTTPAVTPSVAAAAQQGGFTGLVDSLSRQGIPVGDAAVSAEPGEVEVTVQGTRDLYAVVELSSRVYYEAALAKATSDFDPAFLYVNVVNEDGATVSQDGRAIEPLTRPHMDTSVDDLQAAALSQAALTSHGLDGLTIDALSVSTQGDRRTLSLALRSDNTPAAAESLQWLLLNAIKEWGWVAGLNTNHGIGLSWIRVEVTYPGDIPKLVSVVDIGNTSVSTYAGGRVPEFAIRRPPAN